MDYKHKYLKYKEKYLSLKNNSNVELKGGMIKNFFGISTSKSQSNTTTKQPQITTNTTTKQQPSLKKCDQIIVKVDKSQNSLDNTCSNHTEYIKIDDETFVLSTMIIDENNNNVELESLKLDSSKLGNLYALLLQRLEICKNPLIELNTYNSLPTVFQNKIDTQFTKINVAGIDKYVAKNIIKLKNNILKQDNLNITKKYTNLKSFIDLHYNNLKSLTKQQYENLKLITPNIENFYKYVKINDKEEYIYYITTNRRISISEYDSLISKNLESINTYGDIHIIPKFYFRKSITVNSIPTNIEISPYNSRKDRNYSNIEDKYYVSLNILEFRQFEYLKNNRIIDELNVINPRNYNYIDNINNNTINTKSKSYYIRIIVGNTLSDDDYYIGVEFLFSLRNKNNDFNDEPYIYKEIYQLIYEDYKNPINNDIQSRNPEIKRLSKLEEPFTLKIYIDYNKESYLQLFDTNIDNLTKESSNLATQFQNEINILQKKKNKIMKE
jgi:hypothetical protein